MVSNASQQAAIQSQISSARSKKEGYLEEAKKVKEIYDELRKIKSEFVKQKKAVASKKDEHDDSWTGNLHDTKFVTPAGNLISYFDSSIKAMDDNIDELLIKINEYENKALEMDGLIGQLGILLNNISGWIESFFN